MARQTDHHRARSAVSLPAMAGGQEPGAQPSQSEFFARNEALRRQQLREDARRPGGELLEQAMRLSRFATELAAAGRRARR
jgi:hypothetical protein